MEIVTVNPTSLVEFKTINDGDLFKYEEMLYVKTGYISDDCGNDAWNCYRIGSNGGTNDIDGYELVLPVKILTVAF